MAHFKRKKTRRCVRCTICTKYRWQGNSKNRVTHAQRKHNLAAG